MYFLITVVTNMYGNFSLSYWTKFCNCLHVTVKCHCTICDCSGYWCNSITDVLFYALQVICYRWIILYIITMCILKLYRFVDMEIYSDCLQINMQILPIICWYFDGSIFLAIHQSNKFIVVQSNLYIYKKLKFAFIIMQFHKCYICL